MGKPVDFETTLRRGRRRRYREIIRWLGEMLVIALFVIWIMGGVAHVFCIDRDMEAIKVMQTDTLNQIMELRQEIEALQEPAPKPVLNETERELVARVVAAEARGEGYEGQMAVAQVIRDRANLWGKTPTEIVTANLQFAKPYQGEVDEQIYAAVDAVFSGEDYFDRNVTHFHADYISPYWADENTYVGTVGHHKFYSKV